MIAPKAIIFDLYGTLLRIPQSTHPYSRLFDELGLDTQEKRARARHRALTEEHPSLLSFVKSIRPDVTLDLSGYERQIKEDVFSARLYPETTSVLTVLRERVPLFGVLSNLATPYKEPYYILGLANSFSAAFFSCDEGICKPDPRAYALLLERLGVTPAEAIMVGDSLRCDVAGPRAIGMRALLLERTSTSVDAFSSLEGLFRFL